MHAIVRNKCVTLVYIVYWSDFIHSNFYSKGDINADHYLYQLPCKNNSYSIYNNWMQALSIDFDTCKWIPTLWGVVN